MGQGQAIQKLINSMSIYWIGLGIALLILIVIVYRLRAWYRDGDDLADGDDEIVRDMQDLKRRGVLSEEEFRSIKQNLKGHQNQ